MKVGLDYHGVIDQHFEFFSTISDLLVHAGHEVHIITGLSLLDFVDTPAFRMHYNEIYSITDYLLNSGLKYRMDEHGRPIFAKKYWDKAKADYCKKNKIDIMIDDTKRYAKHFKTPFFLFNKM